MAKVYVIKAKDEFELVKKINSSNYNIFATQPIQKLDGSWVAFIYHEGEESKKSNAMTPPSSPPSPKQINFLKSKNVTIPKTKKEATELISNFIKNLDKKNI